MLDTHCHIIQIKYTKELFQFLHKQDAYLVGVTNLPSVYRFLVHTKEKYPRVIPSLGLHPSLYHKNKKELDLFLECAQNTAFIGEIGLDFSRGTKTIHEEQIALFDLILSETKKEHRMYSIHSKRAEAAVLDLLEKHQVHTPILHWYNGSTFLVQRALDIGCYFSINRQMLHSIRGKRVVSRIPLDRILLESDAPYAHTRSIDAYVRHIDKVIAFLARHHHTKSETIYHIIQENGKKILASLPQNPLSTS